MYLTINLIHLRKVYLYDFYLSDKEITDLFGIDPKAFEQGSFCFFIHGFKGARHTAVFSGEIVEPLQCATLKHKTLYKTRW